MRYCHHSRSKVKLVDYCNVLTAVFVVLKLTGVVSWPWWYVLSPALAGTLAVLAVRGFVALKIVLFERDLGLRHKRWPWRRIKK